MRIDSPQFGEDSTVINLTVPVATSFPVGNESVGEMIFRSDEDILYVNTDGTAGGWTSITTAGGGTTASQITLADAGDADAGHFIIFSGAATGDQALETDGEVTYNPSSNQITVPRLRLTATDAGGDASTLHALQIGTTGSTNVVVDTSDIQARNNGVAAALGLEGSSVELRPSGTTRSSATALTFNVLGVAASAVGGNQDAELQFQNQSGTEIGSIGYNTSTDLTVANVNTGGSVQLSADGTVLASTISAATGGLQVNNAFTGGGLERVLTTSDIGSANGAASLDGSGLIPQTQLPSIALTDTFVVASEVAQTGLTAEVGDVAIRTDENRTYILQTAPASTFGNWQEVLTPGGGVTSVASGDGLTGGPITSTGTLSVDFGGNGSATTVARSDHTHALDDLTDVDPTGVATGSILYKSATDWLDTDAVTVDPAAGVELNFNGAASLATTTQGVEVYDSTSVNPSFRLYTAPGGTYLAQIQSFSDDLFIDNRIVNADQIFRVSAVSSGDREQLRITPVDVQIGHSGTDVARTTTAASGGFQVNNTSTGAGFERVLTTSDLGGGGTPTEVTLSASNNSAGNSILMAANATGDEPIRTDAGLTYNASTNALTATSFVGTATISTTTNNATLSASNNGAGNSILMAANSTGDEPIRIDNGLTYNASTNVLTVLGGVDGNASSATTASAVTTAVTNGSSSPAFIPFVADNLASDQTLRTDSGLTFTQSSNTLTVNGSDVLTTASTIVASEVALVTNGNSGSEFFIPHMSGSTGDQDLSADTGLTFIPSSNTLRAGGNDVLTTASTLIASQVTFVSNGNSSSAHFIAHGDAATGTTDVSGDTGLTFTPSSNLLHTDGSVEAGASGTFRTAGNGTATNVAFGWTTDTNTGMYRGTTDVLRFATGGTERLEIEADGTLNVGGTTNYENLVTADDDIPNKKYVDDLVPSQLNLVSNGNSGTAHFITHSDLSTGEADLSGDTGFLFTPSTNLVHTDGSYTAGTSGTFRTGGNGTAGSVAFGWTADTNTGMYRGGTDILRFSTAGVERLEIEADGTLNVGGTTNYEALVTTDDDIPNKKYVDDNFVATSLIGANNGVASLDGSGMIPAAQLPALAITDTFVVASQSAQTSLTAEVGDVAVRTDNNTSYILQTSPASTFGNWQEILTPGGGVTSVGSGDGLTGGPITSTGTLAVDFAGSGVATTVARSDHDHTLDSLSDVDTTGVATGNVLYKSGSDWVDTDAIVIDPAAEITLSNNGDQNLVVETYGIRVHRAGASANAAIQLGNDTDTTLALIQSKAADTFLFQNQEPGFGVRLDGRNAGDTTFNAILEGDPDGTTSLFFNGIDHFGTQASGVHVSADTFPQLQFTNQDGSTNFGFVFYDTTSDGMTMRSSIASDHLFLKGFDTGAAETILLEGDPDGPVDLYFDGAKVFQTTNQGVDIDANAGQVAVLGLGADTGVDSGINFKENGLAQSQILWDASNDNFHISTSVTGGSVSLGAALGGELFLEGTEGGSVDLYFDGSLVASTNASGLVVSDSSGDTAAVTLRDSGGNQEAVIFTTVGDAGLTLRSNAEGLNVVIDAEDAAGLVQKLFEGDPDSSATIFHDGTQVISTRNDGLSLRGDGTDTVLNFENTSGGQTGFMRMFEATGNFEVQGVQNGGIFSVIMDNTAGSPITLMQGDPDTSNIFDTAVSHQFNINADDAFHVRQNEARLYGNIADTPFYSFYTDAGARLAFIQANTTQLIIRGEQHGGAILMQGEDAGGVLRTMATLDPDANLSKLNSSNGSWQIEHNGVTRIETTGSGANFTGSIFDFDNSAASTLTEVQARNSAGGWQLGVLDTTANVQLSQTGSTGFVEDVWVDMTRNAGVGLRHNNTEKLVTTTNGITIGSGQDVTPTSGGVGQLSIDGNGYSGYIALNGTAMYLGTNSASRDVIIQTNETDRVIIDDIGMQVIPVTDVALNTSRPAFMIGNGTGVNMAMDNNEIMARNNGAASTLNLNINGGTVVMGDSAGSSLQVTTGGNTTIRRAGTIRFTVDTAGVDVTGTIDATGDITANSDIRLKENIEPIEDALSKVNQIRGVTFDMINDEQDRRHAGVIAQEVEEVLPEVVHTQDDEMGTKSIAYGNMVGLLVEAVKELTTELATVKAELAELKK